MAGTFSDSWKLTRTAFSLIAEDRALLVFPLVAGLSIVGLLALIATGEYFLVVPALQAGGGNAVDLLGFVLLVLGYLSMTLVSVLCGAALIGAATMKLGGRQPSAADGWRVARGRLGRLIVWALISATVGLVIQLVASRVRGVGGLVIGIVGGVAWSVVTYFMIPVLLFEDQRPWPALKRSAHLFTSTFGRTLASNLFLALLIGLGIVGAFVLGLVGLYLLIVGSTIAGIALIVAGIAIGSALALVGAAAEGIVVAALYRYATTGKIDRDLLPAAYGAPAPLP